MAASLKPWRWAAALALLLIVGVPLVLPLVEVARHGVGAGSWSDWQRIGQLFANTLILVAGTLALAMPTGVALAVLLFRCDFPGRRLLLGFTLLMLFVPLPTIASAWQAFFGADGWLPLHWLGMSSRRPWTTGLAPAIWVHFVAGLPWVTMFVGLGLTWVERELEEELLLYRAPWWVLLRITLPRCRGSIAFAAVWLALQVAGEITVVYVMEVATFAEEVHSQFAQGDGALARAVTATLPLTALTWVLLTWALPRLGRVLPPLQHWLTEPSRFSLRAWRWPSAVGATVLLLLLFGVPLGSLLWKLGKSGHPPHWSAADAARFFQDAVVNHGVDVGKNVLAVVAAGLLVSGCALCLCWLGQTSVWMRGLLTATLALAWSLPGPIIGIGLKQTIATMPEGLLTRLFYHGPSPLPLLWAYLVRFLPFAVALLWPIVGLAPREQLEAARLEGHGPWHEFRVIIWPLTRRAVFVGAALVMALSLGEVAASLHAETPGWQSFAKLLFARMHYGVDNNVAALCLLLFATLVIVIVFAKLAISKE